MTWPDGSMYCGSFKKGLKEGRGIQTNADGSMSHCGLWRKDKPYIEGERVSATSSFDSSDSLLSGISLSDSARFRNQYGCLNTSEEDIVIMESQSVAVAEETMHVTRSPSNGASLTNKEPQDMPNHSKALTLSPEVQAIPATPSKMDDVSSIGSDHDVTPNFLLAPVERISL